MRLAGGDELEGHAARALRRRRMTSTGAATPVQRSNEAAPWRTSTSRPSTTTSQPGGAGGLDERGRRAVGAVGEVDDGLSGVRLDEQLVPDRRRVDDRSAPPTVGRPVVVAPRDEAHVGAPACASAAATRPRRAAGAEHGTRARGASIPATTSPSVSKPSTRPVARRRACSRSRRARRVVELVAEQRGGRLVRHGHVRAGEARARRARARPPRAAPASTSQAT